MRREGGVPHCKKYEAYMQALNSEVSAYGEDVKKALTDFNLLPSPGLEPEVLFRTQKLPFTTFTQIIEKIWVARERLSIYSLGGMFRFSKHHVEKINAVEKFLMQLPFSNVPDCPKEVALMLKTIRDSDDDESATEKLWNLPRD